jgi:hypothetical protein
MCRHVESNFLVRLPAVRLLKSINFSVDPCDDFFDFTCGRWIAENQIPPSSSRWSQFNALREEVNNITQGQFNFLELDMFSVFISYCEGDTLN